jgi:hypothetical protein
MRDSKRDFWKWLIRGSATEPARSEFEDLSRVVAFFTRLIVFGLIAAAAYSYGLAGFKFVGSVLWALAFLAAGGATGFLFGIPKVLQATLPQPGAASANTTVGATSATARLAAAAILSYRQRVNTNLEEISDWLTKIIVGVSLIQLKSVPDLIWRLASVVSGSFGTALPIGFGVAVLMFFAPVGFLFGYLVTRLYIQGALARAERLVEEEGVRAERTLAERSDAAQRDVESALKNAAQRPQAADGPAAVTDPQQQLKELADQYLRFEAESWSERVRVKNELAAQMAALIIQHGISRDELARSTHEGLLVGLAAAAQHSPQAEDPRRLLEAASRTSRLHVQYRFVLAFARLFESGFISSQDKSAVLETLTRFEARADESLRNAIAALRRRLEDPQ